MILVCKGTCAPVSPPFKCRGQCPRNAPPFQHPCLYCYLLPQCEALHTCCSGFPIAKWCCDKDVKCCEQNLLTTEGRARRRLHIKNVRSVRFVVKRRGCFCNLSVGVVLNVGFTTNGMCAKSNTYIYVARKSNSRVIATHGLYCYLLPQCEALRSCRPGFLIATIIFGFRTKWQYILMPRISPFHTSGVLDADFGVQSGGYWEFFGFGLDWISFSLQPDPEPDYPNEINCDHRKNLKWINSFMKKKYTISK